MIPASRDNGRPGMDLWKILIFGTLRLTINCDYDRLQELANEHGTLRQKLGHGPIEWAACLSSEQQESLWRQSNFERHTEWISKGKGAMV